MGFLIILAARPSVWTAAVATRINPTFRGISGRQAQTFNLARADFDAAWKALLPPLTEADFQRGRDARDGTAKKYAMWERDERLPSQKPSSMMGCPCGEMFDSHRLENTLIHVPHITAEHKSREVRRAQTVQRSGSRCPKADRDSQRRRARQ